MFKYKQAYSLEDRSHNNNDQAAQQQIKNRGFKLLKKLQQKY
jgi:hypothetical protein